MKSFAKIAAATICLLAAEAHADPIKIGIVAPFSGPFAVYGENFKYGIEVLQKLKGTRPAGQEIELIYRDLPGPNPAEAKALTQELIVKEKVQYIGGFVFTPNALAAASTIQQGKVPTVIFNAATSGIPAKSDYIVRTSYTLWQITVPIAKYMLDDGVKTAVTLVSDYAPGLDAETSFKKVFEAGGGKVLDTIRVPLKATDFGPFMQRVKMLKPQAIYSFFPGGPVAIGVLKSYAENDLKSAGIRFVGSSETNELDLQSVGDAAIGVETGHFYSAAHDSPENKAFVAVLHDLHPSARASVTSIEAYDGLDAIYRMIEGTGGQRDPAKAMATIAGASWVSPRGPMKIDPVTRHVTQNVYIRIVERDSTGLLINKEVKTYENSPDYGLSDIAN
jgi:branched-chain amino acid transport system substrate-binding protein